MGRTRRESAIVLRDQYHSYPDNDSEFINYPKEETEITEHIDNEILAHTPYLIVNVISYDFDYVFFYDIVDIEDCFLKIKTAESGIAQDIPITNQDVLSQTKVIVRSNLDAVKSLARRYIQLREINESGKNQTLTIVTLKLDQVNDPNRWLNILEQEHRGNNNVIPEINEILTQGQEHLDWETLQVEELTIYPDRNAQFADELEEDQLITPLPIETDPDLDPWESNDAIDVTSTPVVAPEDAIIPAIDESVDTKSKAVTEAINEGHQQPKQLDRTPTPPSPAAQFKTKIDRAIRWGLETFGLFLLYLLLSIVFAALSGSLIPIVTNVFFPLVVLIVAIGLRVGKPLGDRTNTR